MREYLIRFACGDEPPAFIILPSWWKMIWWLLRKSWHCSFLSVFYYDPAIHGLDKYLEESDPCDSCLRWPECNGVDIENCPKWQ